jgi:Transposase DDE domain
MPSESRRKSEPWANVDGLVGRFVAPSARQGRAGTRGMGPDARPYDDRQPLRTLAQRLRGRLCGDRGAMAQAWHAPLLAQGLARPTTIRKPMQHRLRRLWETWLLRQGARMAPITAQGQHSSPRAHTRHRSVTGCMGPLMAGLVASSAQPNKPSLGLRRDSIGLVSSSLSQSRVSVSRERPRKIIWTHTPRDHILIGDCSE